MGSISPVEQSTAPGVEYSAMPGCPGQFFRCEPQRATLSVTSCSKMWQEANSRRRDPCDRLHHCQGCEIGAAHSGVAVVRSNPLYGARICSRCHRTSHRLIHDEDCPSCYNRQRELEIGRNGKGTRPVKHPPLEPRRLLVACDGKVIAKVFKRTIDTTEAIVSVLRHMPGSVMLGYRGRIVGHSPTRLDQLELF